MKSKNRPTAQPANPAGAPKKSEPARPPLTETWNQKLGHRPYRVLAGLIVLWIVVRIFLFSSVLGSPLYQMYRWQESDSNFFDTQARSLAAGDWLNRQPLHPYHGWHEEMANSYFSIHPDKLNDILVAHPGRDSKFQPGKALWDEWYGGNTYHQEPLYAYILAFLYVLTGNGAYWMLVLQGLLGIGSGVLLWLLARRYFDNTIALLTGLLYALCGIVLFQEVLLLRTTWAIFFALLTVWTWQRALDRGTTSAFLISGITMGFAFLLQSIFVLYLLGALVVYLVQERKTPRSFAQNGGLVLAGFLLVFAPVMLRNAAVSAPLFSTSSVGAITFVATNVQQTQAINRWQPELIQSAEIMGSTGGKFMPAAWAALQTQSIGSYLQLEWSKFKSLLNGQEWPNNENYAFYQNMVPVLNWTFLNFYWIAWMGVAGLMFAAYYRKKCVPLYLAIGVQVLIMLAFYVLGRLRAPLAVLLLPFSAYCLVECFLRFSQTTAREGLVKIGVVAACIFLLAFLPYRQRANMLDMSDYNVLYELTYYERIKTSAEAKRMQEAIDLHTEFLGYQPDFVNNLKPSQLLKTPAEASLVEYFANHHQIQSYLFEDSGNKGQAEKEMGKYQMLKRVVEHSQMNGGR